MPDDLRATLAAMKERGEEYRSTMDLEVVHDWAGEAVNDDLALVDAVQAVLDLHRPVPVYDDECADPDCGQEHIEVYAQEYYHAASVVGHACEECSDDGDGGFSIIDYPCPTVRAINEKLEGL